VAGSRSVAKKSRSNASAISSVRRAGPPWRLPSAASTAPNTAAMKRSPKPITADPNSARWNCGSPSPGAAAFSTLLGAWSCWEITRIVSPIDMSTIPIFSQDSRAT